jgi:Flp pilus assembly pilin Flp
VKSFLQHVWRADEGVLTFEWILLITVLVIGVVGGLSAVRDAVLTELGDVAEAVISLDQSYTILYPWDMGTPDCAVDGASDSSYTDGASYHHGRLDGTGVNDQGPIQNCEDNGAPEAPNL